VNSFNAVSIIEMLTNSLSESECASCFEDFPTTRMYSLKCKHLYCLGCFTALITTSMRTESMFPPKCCLVEIPMKDLLSALDKTQKEIYKSKAAEFALKPESRWYCPDAQCGIWIPPSKLHRLRILGGKCPSCDTKICGYCRGKTHEAGTECPEDFGLEATLQEAERQGWRRCYKCRALVELTAGCRHITCKCKAQFCYTCGAKWPTCSCSEVDQRRRQNEIAERRNAYNARSAEEEAEIAQAIAAIEKMERSEARERARESAERERREALQRAIEANERKRREHLEHLEAEKRRIEEEEASKRREEAIRNSITERINHLRRVLREVQQYQQTSLISRHNSEIAALDERIDYQKSIQKTELDSLHLMLDSNSALRRMSLQSAHESTVAELTSKHEAEEDDTFLTLQEHLQGKPNRETRMKAVMNKLQQRQKDDLNKLVERHMEKIKRLGENISMERNALQAGHTLQSTDHTKKSSEEMSTLHNTILRQRKYFEVIADRRKSLLESLHQDLYTTSGLDLTHAPLPPRGEECAIPSSSTPQTHINQKLLVPLVSEKFSRPIWRDSVGV
jgi:hypothetical protein